MDDVIFEVKGLKKYFPIYSGLFRHQVGVFKAVDGMDFKIPKGSVLGLVGESGSGKSTVARASIRLIEPTAGTIKFLGQSLMDLKPAELKNLRKNIQMIFQDPYASLNPRKPIWRSIGEALLYHQIVKTEEEQRHVVEEVLTKVGMSPECMDRYPHEFSGGQQQRVCIGRAIAMNPKLIICDEAVSALDVSIQAQIINLLMDLKETMDLSYLFISHDLSIVRHMADEVIVMQAGKEVERGFTEELFKNPQEEYTRTLLASIPPIYPKRI